MPTQTDKTILSKLKARGLCQDVSEGLDIALKKGEAISTYIGFDPTAPSLHVGNLATIMLLLRMQLVGHKPFVLIGGATASIGDPSGKRTERPLLSIEEIEQNTDRISDQLEKFLDFSKKHPQAARILNNDSWLRKESLLDFLRKVGKHFPMSYLLAKDTIKNRLESGISFTECSYQLLQAYDFYHLYKEYDINLQMGGSDQWGNITSGITLIRKKLNRTVYGLTTPLMLRKDGTKFGKTEEGTIWLDETRTSPYAFYQFWYNQSDEESEPIGKIFTLLTDKELEDIQAKHRKAPHLRHMQKKYAQDITSRVHGSAITTQVITASELLFHKDYKQQLEDTVSEKVFQLLAKEIPYTKILQRIWEEERLSQMLCEEAKDLIFSSKSAFHRLVKERGLSVNGVRVQEDTPCREIRPYCERYFLIRKGKKAYYLLELT